MTATAVDRRQLLALGFAALPATIGAPASAQPAAAAGPASRLFVEARAALARGREIRPGRIVIDIPRLAENGNSVPLKITVESPMTTYDHVRTIHVLSEQNPIATIGRFHLSPRSGRAMVETYVRLATTQNIHAIAEMSDGSLHGAAAESVVLLAACLDGG